MELSSQARVVCIWFALFSFSANAAAQNRIFNGLQDNDFIEVFAEGSGADNPIRACIAGTGKPDSVSRKYSIKNIGKWTLWLNNPGLEKLGSNGEWQEKIGPLKLSKKYGDMFKSGGKTFLTVIFSPKKKGSPIVEDIFTSERANDGSSKMVFRITIFAEAIDCSKTGKLPIIDVIGEGLAEEQPKKEEDSSNSPSKPVEKTPQPEKSPEPEKTPAPEPEEFEMKACQPNFLTARFKANWYKRNRLFRKLKFKEVAKNCGNVPPQKNLAKRKSIPVFWINLSVPNDPITGKKIGWSDAQAQAKMNQASRWFRKYCIGVPVQKLTIPNQVATQKQLKRIADKGRVYQSIFKKINKDIFIGQGKPSKFQLVIFTNELTNGAVYDLRIDKVAANFARVPIILVPYQPEVKSQHIVTHELMHAFGKVNRGTKSRPYSGNYNKEATWNHGTCIGGGDMGNATQRTPAQPFFKRDQDMMDFASYWHFARNQNISGGVK